MDSIDRVLEHAMHSRYLAGLVAVATNPREDIYRRTLNRERGDARLGHTTLFPAGALIRPLLAIAALQLVEAKRIELDERLDELLPELAEPRVLSGFDWNGRPRMRRARRAITLRRLLNHTSGIRFPVGGPHPQLVCEPGRRWFHGPGFHWLPTLVERASGVSTEEYLRNRIFASIDMVDTNIKLTESGMSRFSGSLDDVVENIDDKPLEKSLYTSAADFTKLLRALLRRDPALLSDRGYALLHSNQIGSRTVPRSCGLRRVSTPSDINTFPEHALYGFSPAKWSLGFMINTDQLAHGPRPETMTSAGGNGTFCWVDTRCGVAGLLFSVTSDAPGISAEPNVFESFQGAVYSAVDRRPTPRPNIVLRVLHSYSHISSTTYWPM